MRDLQDVLIKPMVSEKSIALMEEGKYSFVVAKDANKIEIKQAVEKLFDVKVDKVNTSVVKGHKKTQNTKAGRTVGKTSDFKKAIVTLNADSKTIAFFDSLS